MRTNAKRVAANHQRPESDPARSDAGPNRHNRFTEGDDDDESVAFDEMLDVDAKALNTANEHNTVIDCDCDDPEYRFERTIEETGEDEQCRATQKSRRGPEDCIARFGRRGSRVESNV